METDELYMRRCLTLAAMGLGTTYPNPMVGAVIVSGGKIIGEGYHIKAGGPHAEVNAANNAVEKGCGQLLAESTMYVSLEPCAHFGRTPPCADLIISRRIPRVVVGCADSFSKVAGKGIERMRTAGIDVKVGVLEKECRHINRRFFTFHEKQRPYIILKWAQSADGFIAPVQTPPGGLWLTNDACRARVHKQRTEEQAILIGSATAKADNPLLTPRDWAGNTQKRYILSPKESVDPKQLRMAQTQLSADNAITVLTNGASRETDDNVRFLHIESGLPLAHAISNTLYSDGIQSVIVEGGARTLSAFVETGLWDEAHVYTGTTRLGAGVKAPAFAPKSDGECTQIGTVRLETFHNI